MTNDSSPPTTLSLITAPFEGGQGKRGVDEGPKHLMEMNLFSELTGLGYKPIVRELSFPVPTHDPNVGLIKRPRYVSQSTELIHHAVKNSFEDSKVVLTIGGDHSIAIGTVSGVQAVHPDAVVLWIDAHADINTPTASTSGNLHGCPVSFLVGAADPIIDQEASSGPADIFSWVPKCLDHSRLAYIGLRDVDTFEKKYLRENNIASFSMHHVDKWGIAQVVERALKAVDPEGRRPIHLSFDVDAVDPTFAPSTGTPVRGGLTWREACYLCEAVAETGRLVAMDLVECNPHLGEDPKDTISLGLSLIRSALGDNLL